MIWHNKVKYLQDVDGDQIVKAQDEINDAQNTFVTATQIFLIGKKYDCFIYYKVKV